MFYTLKRHLLHLFNLLGIKKGTAFRYIYLFEAIQTLKPKNIMEIGVWNGGRGVRMIKLAQKFHPNAVHYFGTDLFEEMDDVMMVEELSKRPPGKREVEARLSKTGADIRLIAGNTLLSLPEALSSLPQMDFVFIDGGHAVETIESDWRHVQRLMHDDTVVIFDDYYEDRDDLGAKAVIDGIDTSLYSIEILPIQDVFKKKEGDLKINFVRVTKK